MILPLSRFFLFLLLLMAAHTDLRTRRIPNRLTLAGFAGGLTLGLAGAGWSGLGAALLGGLAGFAVFFFLYTLGAMGAGDVKLMAAAGTFLGVPLVFGAALWSAIAGGILALIVVVRGRAARRVAANVGSLLTYWVETQGVRRAEWLTLDRPDALKLPYGVAIAVGCGFVTFFPHLSVF